MKAVSTSDPDRSTWTRKFAAGTTLIEEAPPAKRRRLPIRRTLLISHLPNGCLLDQKPSSGPGNSHASVIIGIAALRYTPEQSRSFVVVQRFRREPRWQGDQLFPVELEKMQSRLIRIIQKRIAR